MTEHNKPKHKGGLPGFEDPWLPNWNGTSESCIFWSPNAKNNAWSPGIVVPQKEAKQKYDVKQSKTKWYQTEQKGLSRIWGTRRRAQRINHDPWEPSIAKHTGGIQGLMDSGRRTQGNPLDSNEPWTDKQNKWNQAEHKQMIKLYEHNKTYHQGMILTS